MKKGRKRKLPKASARTTAQRAAEGLETRGRVQAPQQPQGTALTAGIGEVTVRVK